MATRLDRLFVLLDTGSSAVTRKTAAQQLGEVQRLHPHELHNLLAKVHLYLCNETWETRIAAGQAIEAIAKNVPQWRPVIKVKEESSGNNSRNQTPIQRFQADRLEFSKFDISKVLEKGASLLGSAGTEYELDYDTGSDPKERLLRQRKLLQKRLGLDMAGSLGMETDDLFNDDDLLLKKPSEENKSIEESKDNAADLIAQNIAKLKPGMSSREKNRAKRRAKLFAKQRSKDKSDRSSTSADQRGEPAVKKMKKDKSGVDSVDGSIFYEEPGDWPFTSFCEQLANDIFHSSWVVRHGAATGIREVLKIHGQSAGKFIDYPLDQQDSLNQSWLEDMALRLLCVLALDRFGDFVSDEVVAPIRETAAQALGVIIRQMADVDVQGVLGVLLQLLQHPQWEARHGGLLGLKYLLAVRKDLTKDLIIRVIPSITTGLQDVDDDVRAVAASSLIPAATELVQACSVQLPAILQILWDALLDLDDLTASTSSIMTLLASLLSQPSCQSLTGGTHSIDQLVPRLWPFLRHNSSVVRKAALDTLLTLLDTKSSQITTSSWLNVIVQDALKHTYQRCILETVDDILETVQEVWEALLKNSPLQVLTDASLPLFNSWLCLAMQPTGLPIDKQMLVTAKHKLRPEFQKSKLSKSQTNIPEDVIHYIGGDPSLTSSPSERESVVLKTRLKACKLLGQLAAAVTSEDVTIETVSMAITNISEILSFHLQYKSSVQVMVIAVTVDEWARKQNKCRCSDKVVAKLKEVVSNNAYFDEVSPMFMRLQSECKGVVSSYQKSFPNISAGNFPNAFTVDSAESLVNHVFENVKRNGTKVKAKSIDSLNQRCKQVQGTLREIDEEQMRLKTRTQCCIASALMLLRPNPEKLNPIIKPFMESIKKEKELLIQERAAHGIARLIEASVSRNPCPNGKIVRNVCSSLCCDLKHTPSVANPLGSTNEEASLNVTSGGEAGSSRSSSPLDNISGSSSSDQVATCDKMFGILTLSKQQQLAAAAAAIRRNIYSKQRSKAVDLSDLSSSNLDPKDDTMSLQRLQRRGAQVALVQIAERFGPDLFKKVDVVWLAMTKVLDENIKLREGAHFEDDQIAEELVAGLQAFEAISPVLHPSLYEELLTRTPHLITCLSLPYTSIRHMAARCISALAKSNGCRKVTMNQVMLEIVPLLGATHDEFKRQGAMECIACIIDQLGMEIIPYIVLLVVPLLGTMSDQTECIRMMATQCFATLIRLMPLESGIPDPPSMAETLVALKMKQRIFLDQLFNTSKLESYLVPDMVKADLRRYQQDGVNWLAFLNKYKLHGILCDDMGLGKTLMSICILAGDHANRLKKYQETGSADCAPLPSIVICPPTLTGHWVYEVEHFCPWSYLRPLQYTGPVNERMRLQKRVKKYNLVVASYDIVRNDIEFLKSFNWNYCILDEGHIIKNGKTKMSKAIKQLNARHRLILSGTPIQNNVLELWSLFDFLMPGFLGTEKQFNARYSKPILQSRDAKSSSKEQEAGALAMEALHRQVLPFLLRRLKEDVLDDLPPKIIQDYYCDLSPLQIQLYEDFAKSRAKKEVDEEFSSEEKDDAEVPAAAKTHVFQAIQYLKKVCNHPLLVLNEKHPKYSMITEQIARQKSSLHDIQHAPKLVALKQLLQDCGVGVESLTPSQGELGGSVVGQHRILLFCQMKGMLDIVEEDLLKALMPSVTYLRLDGTVPTGQRHGIVQRFNNDPSIDILLLTTHVGGLGLNLTGADTVIFVEHDWNPTKDLQAMDRAHRIGQKKVVNVYRLITKGTLEEKIMSLQKFKMNIANAVITQDNSSLHSMGTDQLLDLFSLDKGGPGVSSDSASNVNSHGEAGSGMRNIISNLGDLWEQSQYEDEYNLDGFVQSLS